MDQYKVLELLGEGAYGKCYLLKKTGSQTKYVSKIISLVGLSRAETNEIYKEVKILEQLRHPNIIGFVEVFKSRNNKLNIVMEYADGGDLSQFLKAQRGTLVPEEEVLDILAQLCHALKYVHQHNIIHRDLKTQNIFLTKKREVKLGDFGISKMLRSSMDKALTCIGTPYYMSPEILQEQPYSFPADIWSLGVLIYELCVQRPPFEARSIPALAEKILHRKVPPLPDAYSQDLSSLVSSMLQKDPLRRPTALQVLNHPRIKSRLHNQLNESLRRLEPREPPNPHPKPVHPSPANEEYPRSKFFEPALKPVPMEVMNQDFTNREEERKRLWEEIKRKKEEAYSIRPVKPSSNEDERLRREYEENRIRALELQQALVEKEEDAVIQPFPEAATPEDAEIIPFEFVLGDPVQSPSDEFRQLLQTELGPERFQSAYEIIRRLKAQEGFQDHGTVSFKEYLTHFLSLDEIVLYVPQLKVLLSQEDRT